MKSWNDVLNYIKSRFTNQNLELSDKEILTHLSQHTLPEFSIYVPRRFRVMIDTSNCVNDRLGIFEIPIPENENFEIIDIYDWYPRFGSGGAYDNTTTGFSGAIDAALSVWFNDASNTSPQIYPLIDQSNPNQVIFNTRLSDIEPYLPAVLDLKVTHSSPQTIPTEIYYRWFKPYAYADILILLGTIRSKFQQLNTPLGQIITNAEQLKQEGETLKQQIIQELKDINVSNLIFF